ncbi:tail fiber domain-containing protein [Candidatus Competibacter phosphatis]|uniref:Tail fiber domain-containing protein n=1 Tax=Candidatus Competibacter phosphatis TaxID=221280 RepID=A0ABX1THX8_9GAMM|nr:tail fiber domain-containing protein [Candidatus Competibacter phosphatis]NMQ18985.1 tail fiber domain-containing protein [Candidatus Competibacter phosphatis]
MTKHSDRLTKENIVRIGIHPLGIGLYLFDYKPEFRDAWGHGRQFGVMADEIEKVMPEAVSVHLDGYKMVNYAMLGISRSLH